jgi:uncharacterized protein (TIGR02217 family)
MSGFHEVQLPIGIALDAKGGGSFLTSVTMAQSGFEQRNINWEQTRGKYNVGFLNKNQAYTEKLLAFFRCRFGKAYGFRMRDWSDYKAVRELVGVGTGSAQNLQLVKTYTSGGYSFTRKIRKPVTDAVKDADGNNVANTVHIYYDGVEQSASASPVIWTLDYTTGILTVHASNGVVITWSGEFDIPVRFDTDDQQITTHIPDRGPAQYSWPDIPVLELRTV